MSLTSGFIDVAACNAYFASDTLTDDFIIRTGSNNQRIVLATLATSNSTMILSNNIVSFASNVGIGKSNPQYALDVAGTINAANLFVGGQPYVSSASTQWSNTSSNVFLIGSNVGIGKSNPGYLLDVAGIVNATSLYVGGAPYIGSQWSNVSSNVFLLGSNVGIGVSNPQATLQVGGNMQVNGSAAMRGFQLTRSTGLLSNYYTPPIQGFSNVNANITIYTPGSNTTDSIIFVTGSNPTEKVRITGGGNLGIGTSSPSYPLHVAAGSASTSIFAAGDIIGLSDISVKTDLEKITNALSKVKSLNGYTFRRTDGGDSTKRHAGVLAQEVQAVLPEVVAKMEDGKLSVAYGNIIALLIEAIKELDAKVNRNSQTP